MARHETDSAVTDRRSPLRSAEPSSRGRRQQRPALALVAVVVIGLAFVPVLSAAAASGGETTGSAAAAAAPTTAETRLVVADATADPGGTATHRIALTDAPDGLAGFDLTLELSGDSATVSNASYPETYGATTDPVVRDDGRTVTLEAVDLTDEVTTGAADVTLATIDVTATEPGSVTVAVTDVQVDADGGDPVEPSLEAGRLTVDGNGTPADSSQPGETESADETGADRSGPSDSEPVPGFTAVLAVAGIAVLAGGLIERAH